MPIELSEMNFEKHYFNQTSEQIKAITQPLRSFGITSFDHFRIYDDNSGIDLTTIPQFCEFFGKNHLYRYGCAGNFDEYTDGYYFWDTLGSVEVFKALEQQCKISHGITIVKTYPKYCDHFYLSGALNNPAIKNFFISNRDIIEVFIEYYYSEAKELIMNARPHSYIFPNDKKECDELTNPKEYTKQEVLNFKQEVIMKSTLLTKRQLQCICHSALGKSAKEVAKQLNIAPKTVEHHLDNARKKLGVRNKVALIKEIFGFYSELSETNGS